MSQDVKKIDPQELTMEDVHKHICPEATKQEVFLFLQIAKQCDLNPFLSQIYLIKYGNQKAQILTSYNVYLQRAERSGKYAGMETSTSGSVKNGDLKAVAKVFRKDWDNPLTHEVYYEEYVQRKKDGTPNRFWKEKPRTMICKVAISQAFRLAFPVAFEGMPYTSDEINTIDMPQKAETAEKAPESPKFAKPQAEPVEAEIVENSPVKSTGTTNSTSGQNFNLALQEELDAAIQLAIDKGFPPDAILNTFSSLGYKIKKMKKALKLSDIDPEITKGDLQTVFDGISKGYTPNEA